MDGSLVMESFDSFWFFSNVFSSSTAVSGPTNSDEVTTQINQAEEPVNEESPKPMSPIVQIQQKEAKVPIFEPEIVKPVAKDVVQYYSSPSQSPRSGEKEKRRRRSRKGLQRHKRKILGELELGFDDHVEEEVSGSWSSTQMVEGNCGINQGFGDQQKINRMPSISDNMAMKEHLKSWAYAVACTVR